MKSSNSVGRAFTDVWEGIFATILSQDVIFQLAGLLPTNGDGILAPRRGKKQVRQAPLRWEVPSGATSGARSGVPSARSQEVRKSTARTAPRPTGKTCFYKDSGLETRSSDFFRHPYARRSRYAGSPRFWMRTSRSARTFPYIL